jgi:hypothetical protein
MAIDHSSTSMGRKPISKKVRFEVFKRDGFKCQYCGACAPEVVLEVDHIHPVSKDGDHDIMNFVTSCFDCNRGKSDRLLSDDSVVAMQRRQLDQLSERREQLEMMLRWRDGLRSIDTDMAQKVADAWHAAAPGWTLNENGMKDIRKLIKTFGVEAVLSAIDTVSTQYIRIGSDGKAIGESTNVAFSKIGGVCRLATLPELDRQLYYVRGILRRRVYVNEGYVMELMRAAIDGGMEIDALTDRARKSRSWSEFRDALHAWVR